MSALRSTVYCLIVALIGVIVATPAQAQLRPRLPPAEQTRVNFAVEEGYKYLKRRQQPNGSFAGPLANAHPIGVASLVGLAMIETGSGTRDANVRGAATYVMGNLRDLQDTYDIALAILFLDRLGEENKKLDPYIQMLALRLIGGQTTTGGWSYTCPKFTARDQGELLSLLRRLHEIDRAELGINDPPPGKGNKPAAGDKPASPASLPRWGMCIKAADSPPPSPVETELRGQPAQAKEGPKPPEGKPGPEKKPKKIIDIAGNLALLPVLQQGDKFGEKDPQGKPDHPAAEKNPQHMTDNSNTQFAILAMWVAQRHGVPVDRTLRLIVKRFRETQKSDGGWGYAYPKSAGESTAAMTCSGLSGLAVAFGLSREKKSDADLAADKELIRRGFQRLMTFIDEPTEKLDEKVPLSDRNNLYYLWSIERIAVMYNLKTIGRKDWYRWGMEVLVTNQMQQGLEAGAWVQGGNATLSDPIVNTCFALLFLRGANLASDLTARLPINPAELNEMLMGGGNPAKPGEGLRDRKGIDRSLGGSEDSDRERQADPFVPPTKQDPAPAPPVQTTQQPAPASAPTEQKSEGGGKGLMIAIFAVVAVLVIAGVGAGIFFATRGGKKETDPDEKPRGRRDARSRDDDDEEEEERPRRKPSSASRAPGKRPSRARYDEDDDE